MAKYKPENAALYDGTPGSGSIRKPKKVAPKDAAEEATKAVKKKAAKKTNTINEVEYVLGICYRLMREAGHEPLVVSAMLNSISAGFSLADIGDAMKKFGDIQ